MFPSNKFEIYQVELDKTTKDLAFVTLGEFKPFLGFDSIRLDLLPGQNAGTTVNLLYTRGSAIRDTKSSDASYSGSAHYQSLFDTNQASCACSDPKGCGTDRWCKPGDTSFVQCPGPGCTNHFVASHSLLCLSCAALDQVQSSDADSGVVIKDREGDPLGDRNDGKNSFLSLNSSF
jgi:hypothetical protein